jgi:hypothetical protein
MTEVIDVVDCVGLFEAFASKARQSINLSDRVSGETPNETKYFQAGRRRLYSRRHFSGVLTLPT